MKSCLRLSALILFTLSPLLLCTPAVVHAQWEPDVRLTNDPDSSYTTWNNTWCVAASGDTVHVVWTDTRNGNYEIYTKRSTDGGTSWGSDTRLTYNSGYSGLPSVAVSGTRVHVIWTETRDGNPEIYTKRSTDGGTTWDPDTRLTSDSANSWSPSVAASGNRVHVVWEEYRNGNGEIYTKRSLDGGAGWGTDTRLTSNSEYSGLPSVAVSGLSVHVVWNDYRDGDYEIYTKRSTDGGATWGADTRLTNNNAASTFPSVAASGSNIHVVWYDYRDGNAEIYTKRSTDGGTTWGADTRLTNNSAESQLSSVVVSGSNVHVVWYDTRDGNGEIYYKRSPDGGTSWGADTRLTNNSASSLRPSVAASGLKLHVVWTDARDGNYDIYYKRNPTGNIGVEETAGVRGQGLEVRITAKPNPFTSFATLPGHEAERFSLYDVTGRKVGMYKGDRIGEGLKAGVYFVCKGTACLAPTSAPLKIVKVK